MNRPRHNNMTNKLNAFSLLHGAALSTAVYNQSIKKIPVCNKTKTFIWSYPELLQISIAKLSKKHFNINSQPTHKSMKSLSGLPTKPELALLFQSISAFSTVNHPANTIQTHTHYGVSHCTIFSIPHYLMCPLTTLHHRWYSTHGCTILVRKYGQKAKDYSTKWKMLVTYMYQDSCSRPRTTDHWTEETLLWPSHVRRSGELPHKIIAADSWKADTFQRQSLGRHWKEKHQRMELDRLQP